MGGKFEVERLVWQAERQWQMVAAMVQAAAQARIVEVVVQCFGQRPEEWPARAAAQLPVLWEAAALFAQAALEGKWAVFQGLLLAVAQEQEVAPEVGAWRLLKAALRQRAFCRKSSQTMIFSEAEAGFALQAGWRPGGRAEALE